MPATPHLQGRRVAHCTAVPDHAALESMNVQLGSLFVSLEPRVLSTCQLRTRLLDALEAREKSRETPAWKEGMKVLFLYRAKNSVTKNDWFCAKGVIDEIDGVNSTLTIKEDDMRISVRSFHEANGQVVIDDDAVPVRVWVPPSDVRP